MKKVLGLDIGTNSIGWAFIETNAYEHPETLDGKIIQLGSRIIPMDADAMNKFETGNPESKATGRRQARGARRLNQRYKLRRTRLIEAFKILGWLPDEFPTEFKKLKKHNINKYLPFSDELKKEASEFFGIAGKKTTKGEEYEISEDWIIYFLKTKALHTRITLPELARILYHYNQRRGFKSSRKDAKIEDESKEIKYPLFEKWVEIVTITSIIEKGKGEGKDSEYTFYELTCKTPTLEFTAIKKRKNPLDWLNKNIEVEITQKTTKDLSVNYRISEVDPNAWESRKRALEKDIERENLSISEYYLKNIKNDRNYPVKQRIVDRKFYQDEFKQIWNEQSKFYQKEFTDKNKIAEIANTFYTHNNEKNKELKGKDLFHIFFNDIIYYQRGLKSQKGLLANCQYETKSYKTKNGETETVGVKVVSKSSPCFQEFRIWQTINNIKIIQKEEIINGKLQVDIDKTSQYLTTENKEKLFELFDSAAEVSNDSILKFFGFTKDRIENGEKVFNYRLNYTDELFKGNETKALFRKVFKKHDFAEQGEKYLSDKNLFNQLWHIVYSLPDEKEIVSALNNKKYFDFPEAVIKHISKLPEFKSQYASLSSKAINKLLPLMRVGKYWNENDIDKNTLTRIDKIINGEFDESISDKTRDEIKKRNLSSATDFNGIQTHLAAYTVYGRHSERANEEKYNSVDDLKVNELIPYNSLRNPVVEKVIRETLSLVKDIWANENLGRPDYIHVELGREMKNNNEDRKKIAEANSKNRIEKERIVNLLKELKYPDFNENSLSDVEKFRIWKENGGKKGEEDFDELFKKNNAEFVKDADVEKYRHWAEQNYRSPYSGKAIPLSELFTERYQVDHIISRAKFYDDSFANKVVVEAEFNDRKDNRLAMQFIDEFQGREIHLSNGETRTVLTLDDYKKFVDEVFTSKKKKRFLKLYEVPEDFVERQMNDTKYISRTVAQFLRPIAVGNKKSDDKKIDEGIIYTSGNITSDLKHEWGLNKLWKEILKPRFERLEIILGERLIFPSETKKDDYYFAKDYKRIDHRHHALDALVIACTSRWHIKYLNSLRTLSNNKKEIAKYNQWQQWKYLLNKKKQLENKENGMTEFGLPWDRFYLDAKDAVESIIVSHKPTSKLISKAINKYYKWTEVEPGKWEKKIHLQQVPKDEDKYWVAVRQSLFGQPYGKIHLAEYKKGLDIKAAVRAQIQFLKRENKEWNTEDWRIAKSDVRKEIDKLIKHYNYDDKAILKYISQNPPTDKEGNKIEKIDLLQFKKYASKRVSIDETFTKDKIEKMPYSNLNKNWLTNLLKSHLAEYNNEPKLAFKGEALEMLYKKAPHAINKVTRKETGEKIEKNNKLLDGDKGVNQYFVVEIKKVLDKKTGEEKIKREYYTPNFLDCIERLAKGLPVHDEDSNSSYIVLSPGDLVYVPEEGKNINQIDWNDKKAIAERTYIMKSSQNYQAHFLPADVSTLIQPYDSKLKTGEFESMNKSEKTKDLDNPQVIKENFIKLKVDRLGNIKPA
ncbi:MAG TPA: HNH endonuclease domain-containing protein [Chitinophagaceae bacterium]|nr:HNH endonuclease domain-containing protein [Chitinophagaceae bacterium]